MNKKVQRRQARVRHGRREEILQAGRQWSVDAGPDDMTEIDEAAPAGEGDGSVPDSRRDGDLR